MKNIHLVPSPNPSRLFIDEDDTKLRLYKEPMVSVYATNQNIYITNDEEIKDGTWVIHKRTGKVMFLAFTRSESYNKNKDLKEVFSKIILSTDEDLIKDGVQAIDEEFLQWFVKNPSYEEVAIDFSLVSGSFKYKIIIPSVEPKQETLEEVTKNFRIDSGYRDLLEEKRCKHSFIAGAKWQQDQDKKLYSEEEVYDIVQKAIEENSSKQLHFFDGGYSNPIYNNLKKWFEKHKKK